MQSSKADQANWGKATQNSALKRSVCGNRAWTDKKTEKSSCWPEDRLVFLVSGDGDLIAFQRDLDNAGGGYKIHTSALESLKMRFLSSRNGFLQLRKCWADSPATVLVLFELFCVKQWLGGIKSLFIPYLLPQQTESFEENMMHNPKGC